ncbi:aspartyl-phosphate phosphatase Spo0E family protein [Dethiothermospora halolimnae]|uniref:aspartyl-phosphate phosphatase Spo0E family protein n=1 Tax=Dethiothermospora halolimnae TaxID=3114390 RepID=UPI003CCBCC7A
MIKNNKEQIERLREEMYRMIIEEDQLINEKVILKSQELDKLLNQYQKDISYD